MEGDIVTMQELVRYKQRGVDGDGAVIGEFESCGVQPNCLTRFEEHGVPYDPVSFQLSSSRAEEPTWLR